MDVNQEFSDLEGGVVRGAREGAGVWPGWFRRDAKILHTLKRAACQGKGRPPRPPPAHFTQMGPPEACNRAIKSVSPICKLHISSAMGSPFISRQVSPGAQSVPLLAGLQEQ